MALSHINPFIRYARAHKHLQIRQEISQCYDCRLFFVFSGTGQILANDTKYDFSDNTAIFLPPRTKYRISLRQTGKPFSILIFNFDLVDDFSHLADSLGTASEQSFIPERSPSYALPEPFSNIMVQTIPGLYDPLKGCITDFLTKPPYYRETASAVLKRCLFELIRTYGDDAASHMVGQITDYIHRHYAEPSLTNEQIAEQFGYHPYYLSQLFKEKTDRTLHSYLLYYRIRVAKDYLITTDLDINTISWKCGFNSCAYFIKQFRQHTGITPRQYRKSQMELIF